MALNANALTTLSQAKLQLGMPVSNTSEDARLELFINAASERIARYCDRVFQVETHTEYFHGRRQNVIMPREWPLISVTELRVACDRDFTTASSLIDPSEYSIDDRENTIGFDSAFPTGRSNVRLIYDAGYATIPSDLEMACLWAVEWFYRHRTREDMGMTSFTKSDESVGVLAVMPPMIMEMVHPYKRTEMADAYAPVRNL